VNQGAVYAVHCVPCRYEVWKASLADRPGSSAVERNGEEESVSDKCSFHCRSHTPQPFPFLHTKTMVMSGEPVRTRKHPVLKGQPTVPTLTADFEQSITAITVPAALVPS